MVTTRTLFWLVARTAEQAAPYVTVTVGDDGSFTTRFRLEKQPNGADLGVGPFNLIARSGAIEIGLAFQVETRRPLDGPGPGSGG